MTSSDELQDYLGELRHTNSQDAIRDLGQEAIDNPCVLTVTTAFEVFHARDDTYPEVIHTQVEMVLSELSRQTVFEFLEKGIQRGWELYVEPKGICWEGGHTAAIRGVDKLLQHTSPPSITRENTDDDRLCFERLITVLAETKTLDYHGARSYALSAMNELGKTVLNRQLVQEVLEEIYSFMKIEKKDVATELSDLLFSEAHMLDEQTVKEFVERLVDRDHAMANQISKEVGAQLAAHENPAHQDAIIEYLVPERGSIKTITAPAFGKFIERTEDDTLKTELIEIIDNKLNGEDNDGYRLFIQRWAARAMYTAVTGAYVMSSKDEFSGSNRTLEKVGQLPLISLRALEWYHHELNSYPNRAAGYLTRSLVEMLPELPDPQRPRIEKVLINALRGKSNREVRAALDGLARLEWKISNEETRKKAFKNLFYVGTEGPQRTRILALKTLDRLIQHTDSRECFKSLLRTYLFVLQDKKEASELKAKELVIDNLGSTVALTEDPGLQYATLALLEPPQYSGSLRSAVIKSLQEAVMTEETTFTVQQECISYMLSTLPRDTATATSDTTETLAESLSLIASEIDDALLSHRIQNHPDYIQITGTERSGD